jgi:peptidoglycan/LPS O-acetylase OafA/YrhL
LSQRSFGLDLVRSVAIVMVLICHCSMEYAWAWGLRQPPAAVVWSGFFGVELFFVLSGFLIGSILVDITQAGWTRDLLLRFWSRRWLRTVPGYAVALLFTLCVGLAARQPVSTWPEYVVFAQNLTRAPLEHFFDVSWSLTVEEWFYLLFPLAIIATGALKTQIPGAIIFFIVIPALLRTFFFHDIDWETLSKAVVLRIDAIVYGVGAAYAHRIIGVPRVAKLVALVAGAVMLITAWISMSVPTPFVPLQLIFPLVSIGGALMLPFFSELEAPQRLVGRTIAWLSGHAYTLYLVHMALFDAIGQAFYSAGLPTWFCPFLHLPALLLASHALTVFVERPFMRRRPAQFPT